MKTVLNPPFEDWAALTARPGADLAAALAAVQPVLDAVAADGDAALKRYTEQFDGVALTEVVVDPYLAARAAAELPDDLIEAMDVAARNITAFHAAQAEGTIEVETMPGVRAWRRSVPIERVGLYIPGGTAPLFSTVLMLAIPARLAGCTDIVLCTPPQKDGAGHSAIHPAILHAAHIAGVTRLCAVGGAQAIAALAYGTESVPKVDKIYGPGNRYVTAAKQLVAAHGVATDLPAGPTEVGILVDASTNPAFVAADMLAQAEHGPDSHVFVVAYGDDAATLLSDIETEIARQLETLPRADTARAALENSKLVVVADEDTAVALMDAYAPEHLIISTHMAEAVAARITQAGSVFVGSWTPESLGDYASGTNHTLPTGGAARAYSGVSLDSFVRKITFQQATPGGLARLGPHVEVMAEAEQLSGHARAVTVRRQALVEAPSKAAPHRTGFVRRTTAETDIVVQVDLDGSGRAAIDTGLGFYDHMLDQIARHSGMDLTLRCSGDLHIDEHHTIEDTAITLGQALRKALGDKRGIGRYGFTAPMDDALATVALDLSGRSWLVWDVPFTREHIGDMPTEMFEHFFKSLSDAAAMNLNIQASGENEHHVIESVFKAFARALGDAIRKTGGNALPSTKGAL